MSFLLFACIGFGASLGGYVAGRLAKRRHADEGAERTRSTTTAPEAREAVGTASAFAIGEGDVILATDGREVLLGPAVRVVEDGRPIFALHFGVGAGEQPLIGAFPPPRGELFWLRAGADLGGAAAPDTLEIGAELYVRKRRLPVTLEVDPGAPIEPSKAAIFAEYAGDAPAVAVVLVVSSKAHVFVGALHQEGSLDRFPGTIPATFPAKEA